jgi:hypothetical protein
MLPDPRCNEVLWDIMCGIMLQHLKEDWRHLKHGEPGQRFKDRYYLSQRRNRGRFTFWRVFNLGVGSGIALGGLLMVIAPGPGWLAIFLGLGMLGGEVLPVARFLDWIEVRLRKLVRWVSVAWNSTPGVGKALIVLAILTVVATSAYGAYHFLFGVA